MFGVVYKITNKVNGKIYIGQKKATEYVSTYFGSGRYLKNAINKYGIDNFENYIIEWCYSKEELNAKEIYWIRKYNCNAKNGYGYNIGKGGEGNLMEFATEEARTQWKQKISENKERARKISESKKGKTHSEEHRRKISENKERARKISESKKGENHPLYGKTHSDETRRKISEAMNKPEVKQKLSEAMAKKYYVIYKNKLMIFNSKTLANEFLSKELNLTISAIKNYMYKIPKKYQSVLQFYGNETKYNKYLDERRVA